MENQFKTIEKEEISSLTFPNGDVLEDDAARRQRHTDLERAMTLGNLEHIKMKIFFEDNVSKKVVETTIWGVTDQKIILKQGVIIPINRIYKTV